MYDLRFRKCITVVGLTLLTTTEIRNHKSEIKSSLFPVRHIRAVFHFSGIGLGGILVAGVLQAAVGIGWSHAIVLGSAFTGVMVAGVTGHKGQCHGYCKNHQFFHALSFRFLLSYNYFATLPGGSRHVPQQVSTR